MLEITLDIENVKGWSGRLTGMNRWECAFGDD